MYTHDALRAMDVAETVGRLSELDVRADELNAKHRRSATDDKQLSDIADERRQLSGHLSRLRFAEARATGGGGYALEGPDGVHRLDGTPVPGHEPAGRRDDDDSTARVPGRDAAMRLLERSVRDDLVAAKGAETVERQLDSGPLVARSWTAKWVSATGSDAYRSAFAKKALDPDNGHLLWTAAEAEAWRVASAVQAERAAMSLTDNQGGYLVPFQLDSSVILTSGGSINPLLDISRVETTVTDEWNGVTSDGVVAEWLSEGSEAADASPTFGSPSVRAHKAAAYVEWSFEVGMDANNFLAEISALLLDGVNQLTSQAFTLGGGTGQPRGVVTAVAANGGSLVAPTVAETFSAADLYKVQNAAAPRFQPNASWMMNLAFINQARQFETTNGALRFPELRDNPPRLLGRNVYENSHMDAVINPAATESNYVAVYGDFSQFLITVRAGSTLELIPNVVGVNRRPVGRRGGFLWGRYGSDVLVPNAFRLLSIPTTA